VEVAAQEPRTPSPTQVTREHAAALCERLHRLHQEVLITARIVQATNGRFPSWQDVRDATQQEPKRVVQALVWSQSFDLAREWARFFGQDESEVDLNYLAVLLNAQSLYLAQQILEQLPLPAAHRVCTHLVRISADENGVSEAGLFVQDLHGLQFLVAFLQENCQALFQAGQKDELEKLAMGLAMLLKLPSHICKALKPFMSTPSRIVEDLIMQRLTHLAKASLDLFSAEQQAQITGLDGQNFLTPEDRGEVVSRSRASSVASQAKERRPIRNVMGLPRGEAALEEGAAQPAAEPSLVSFYARRALRFPTDRQRAASMMEGVVLRTEVALTSHRAWVNQDVAEQAQRRAAFRYDDAPNATLCLAIVELHPDPVEGANLCLQLCHELSSLLAAQPDQIDAFLVINGIRQLLFHAKVQYAAVGLASAVQKCDVYLTYSELLRILVAHADGKEYLMSLKALTQKDKAQRLRDRLCERNQYDLAMEVATKCGVSGVVL
jgi:zinc finger FYVE domain-containing protein 26